MKDDSHPTATPPDAPGIRSLTDDETADFLDAHAVAVLAFVDASTPASAKLLDRLQRVAYRFTDQAAFGQLDVRAHALVADVLDVRGVPEVLVFARGRSVDRIAGVPPEDVLADAVRQWVTGERGARERGE